MMNNIDNYRSACMSIRNLLFKKVIGQDEAMNMFSRAFDLQQVSTLKSREDARAKLRSEAMTYQGFVAWLSASCTDNKKTEKYKDLID